MPEALGRAGGKVILAGEHAVVHGQPALAVGLDRGVTVRLHRRPGPSGFDGPAPDPRLRRALESLFPAEGIGVSVSSDLPPARGLGSSAALSVALVRAWAALEGRQAPIDQVLEEAGRLEQIFHGQPSGLDHTAAALGGVLAFEMGSPPRQLGLPDWSMVIIDSGRPRNTAEQVAHVARQRPAIDPLLGAIGDLARQAEALLHDPPALGALLTANHRRLVELGVSSPTLDQIVQLALDAGAFGAKLTGAGGGGVVIALAERPKDVVEAARASGLKAFTGRPSES